MRTSRRLGVLAAAALAAVALVGGGGAARAAGWHARAGRVEAPAAVLRLAARGPRFVTACGAHLCLGGAPWTLRMASAYAMDDHRAETVELAREGGLNTLRLVNVLDESGPVSGAYDEAHWRNVDQDIAAARAAGLHVELDLSTYRNLLLNNGVNPYTADWAPFLSFVADRVNTVTGLRYADDPTIALVAFAGELQPPGYGGDTVHATALQEQDFFTRTFAQWRALDPHHLRTTGGLLFLNDTTGAGIDWKALVEQPGDDVCSMHVYTTPDLTTGMSNLASWCAGRPWVVEEYGALQSQGDSSRAAFFTAVAAREAALGGSGRGFWNLGPGLAAGVYDVNPATPLAWQAATAG